MPLSSETRFNLAAATAPLVPAFLVVVVPTILTGGTAYGNAWFLAILFSVVTSYVGLLVVLPFIVYLRRNGRLTFVMLSVAGVAGGMVLFAGFLYVFAFMLGTQGYYDYDLQDAIWGALLGLTVAVPFGLIAGITNQPSPTR